MSDILQWVLIIIGLSAPAIIVALINYFANKKKIAAETKHIELKNKITEEINYDQLKKDNKHKDIKNKIEIFSQLTKLEEEIKNKTTKTDSDQKKLVALEMLKKEFKETLAESETTEKPLLVEKEDKNQKKKNKRTKKS